ncbi:hypothetical protein GDO86_005862 [Hymenochirus boettgeri]|uniref:C2H2-type domain-containing protein n=1 Tax=Hymenochirus boettgeri TaxID=247094 RepID=A0A8T2JB76_9PIPI|nr:hypothetical protein GDO86_005862 [Hymenochirus boettgeri]
MFPTLSSESENKNEMESEETPCSAQKVLLRDQYCQTDHYHHRCCETGASLEPGDPPLLQQPVQTAKSGIQQVIECFRSGTKQLKNMLLKEVDTIFECKSCRSLFRGLPNLITHKQFYCLSKVHMDENPPSENDKQSQALKDLLEAIYPKVDKPDYIVQLEPIQTNKNAVFQYVKPAAELSDGARSLPDPDPAENPLEETVSAAPVLTPETEMKEQPPPDISKMEIHSSSPVQSPQNTISPPKTIKTVNSSHPFFCRLCKKDFTCRQSIRRHIKKVHRKKLEDIKKCIEIQKTSTVTVKGRTKGSSNTTSNNSCPVCHKSFATKANVRRHIDEVHKGMRRDSGVFETAAKAGKFLDLKITSPKKLLKTLSRTQKPSGNSDFSLSSCRCPYCKRRYTSRFLLKKHVHIVHKSMLSGNDSKSNRGHSHAASADVKIKAESSNTLGNLSNTVAHSVHTELKVTNPAAEKKSLPTAQKSKSKPDAASPKVSPVDKKWKKPKLSAGFDFKQLYCKLCKRQFTSKQNLSKHIELHTDGNNIYVKFYRCPLCSYETRRKRDVIRHITVVHKKVPPLTSHLGCKDRYVYGGYVPAVSCVFEQ